ncbi:hypothetical protein GCM10023075_45480 [Streptosporangium album]
MPVVDLAPWTGSPPVSGVAVHFLALGVGVGSALAGGVIAATSPTPAASTATRLVRDNWDFLGNETSLWGRMTTSRRQEVSGHPGMPGQGHD